MGAGKIWKAQMPKLEMLKAVRVKSESRDKRSSVEGWYGSLQIGARSWGKAD